jgi:hypothetical protein
MLFRRPFPEKLLGQDRTLLLPRGEIGWACAAISWRDEEATPGFRDRRRKREVFNRNGFEVVDGVEVASSPTAVAACQRAPQKADMEQEPTVELLTWLDGSQLVVGTLAPGHVMRRLTAGTCLLDGPGKEILVVRAGARMCGKVP